MKIHSTKIILNVLVLIIAALSFSSAKAQKPKLIGYTLYPCDKHDMSHIGLIQKRIISQYFTGDTLNITVTTTMNCCSGDKGDVLLKEDSLFLISDFIDSIPIINAKGDTTGWSEPKMCECDCCFTLEYKLAGITEKKYVVSINGDVIELLPNKYNIPPYEIVGQDTLLNYDDQGYFYGYKRYESGKIQSVRKEKYPNYYWKTYYENGNLKMEMEFYKSMENAILKEYDEAGNLIKSENNLKK